MTTLTHLLSDGWTVRPAEPLPQLILLATVSATVPGCVHTALLVAGPIPDPYLDDNERVLYTPGWPGCWM